MSPLAADTIEELERRAVASRAVRAGLVVAAVLVLFLGTWCAGSSHGAAKEKTRAVDSTRAHIVDTLKVVDTAFLHDTIRVTATKAKADTAKDDFRAAESQIEAIAAGSDNVPSNLVVPALHVCDQVLAADSVAYDAIAVALDHMTIEKDLWKQRALLDEANEPKAPRLGFKSGLVAGVTLLALVAHFVH